MSKHYPLKFTLEDGINVAVNQAGNDSYHFTLTSKDGRERYFEITDDARPKDEIEASLDFDELNALRRFWLEKQDFV